jgi:hypothetical protein
MSHAERTQRIIEKHNLNKKIESLTNDLLKLPHAVEIEYDLDCFPELPIVIFLVKYDIPVQLKDCYKIRHRLIHNVIETADKHGLRKSEDTIEDYGEHFYFVFYCDKSWRE